MKKFRVYVVAILAIAIACIGFVACNPKNDEKQSVLVVGTTMSVDSLNRLDSNGGAPGYNFDKIASTVSQIAAVSNIDGKYIGVDCNYALSKDGKTLTLTQKDGYKWHDGETVTIDDVEFSLSSLKEGEDYESVQKSEKSLVYELCTSSDTLLTKVSALTIAPKHLLDGKTKDTVTDEQSVVGAGPFKFSSVDKASGTITFEKFADYPKANDVKFDKVIFKQYGSQEVLTLALKNGEIDLIFGYAKGLTSDQISALSSQSDVKLISQATKQVPKTLFFNNQKMVNANVKRAIALSIDYDKIRSTFASAGAAPSREGFVGEGIFGYKETPVWARNLEKAKELLTREGYSQSNKFRFELLVHAGTDDTQYASLLKTQIEESGFVDVVLIEKGSDWQEYYQAGNHMASLAKITAKGYDFEAGYGTRYTLATNTSMLDMKNPVAHGQLLVEDEQGLTEYGKILYAMKNAATSEQLSTAVGEYQDYVAKNVICVALFYDGTTYGASAKLDVFKLDAALGILNPSTFETLEKH